MRKVFRPAVRRSKLMGTWGVTVFSADLAADVRDDFRDLIVVVTGWPRFDGFLQEWFGIK